MCGEKYWKLNTVLSYHGVIYLLYMMYCNLSCVYCCSCLGYIVVILSVLVVPCVYLDLKNVPRLRLREAN